MNSTPFELESFRAKVEKEKESIGEANWTENELENFLQNRKRIDKLMNQMKRIRRVPCYQLCDLCFKRTRMMLKVLLFDTVISAGIFLFFKIIPFLGSFY
jgi:DNA repair exonuclease SbcCD ATPase subunit